MSSEINNFPSICILFVPFPSICTPSLQLYSISTDLYPISSNIVETLRSRSQPATPLRPFPFSSCLARWCSSSAFAVPIVHRRLPLQLRVSPSNFNRCDTVVMLFLLISLPDYQKRVEPKEVICLPEEGIWLTWLNQQSKLNHGVPKGVWVHLALTDSTRDAHRKVCQKEPSTTSRLSISSKSKCTLISIRMV